MAMFASFSKGAPAAPGLERIRAWTRERFGLDASDTILVTELACTVPGCPPLETVVAFWTADGQRHHFKVFKPADAVVPEDLPYAWMKSALAVPEGYGCDCC
jgi:nitrate reductase delta subunit